MRQLGATLHASSITVSGLLLGCFAFAAAPAAYGQASATASASIGLSTFAGVSGVFTGIQLAKNLSVTAGADITFHPRFGLFPSAEVRGTYPVVTGSVGGERNILFGLNVSRHLNRLQPYGDLLGGLGEIKFNTPFPNTANTLVYSQVASPVVSPGGGMNYLVTDRFGVKADFQMQIYPNNPVTSGSIYSKSFTLGVTYRPYLGGLGHGRR